MQTCVRKHQSSGTDLVVKLMMIVLSLFVITDTALTQYKRPGSSDAQFLKIGVSARAEGLGGSFITTVDDASAAYYNAAALAKIQNTDISLNHTMWFAGINHEFISIAKGFGRVGTFAASVTGLYTDEMKVRTPLQPDGTGETFYAGNLRAGVSYARYLTDRVTFGGTVSYINLALYDEFVEHAFSIDIATLYETSFRGFAFGMKIANFGSSVQFVNEQYPLPTTFEFGASLNAIEGDNQTLMVSVAANKPNEGQPLGMIGTEWNMNQILYVRGGYQLNHDTAEYSAGAGLRFSNFRFNYSLSSFSELSLAHRFSLGMSL